MSNSLFFSFFLLRVYSIGDIYCIPKKSSRKYMHVIEALRLGFENRLRPSLLGRVVLDCPYRVAWTRLHFGVTKPSCNVLCSGQVGDWYWVLKPWCLADEIYEIHSLDECQLAFFYICRDNNSVADWLAKDGANHIDLLYAVWCFCCVFIF